LGLFALSLTFHLWGLGWLNSLVFDEIYYVPFGLNYLQGQPFFDAHPPLGKYLIALGMALGQFPASWFNWPSIQLNDQSISPLSYRWLNALTGATLPCLVALLGFYLSAAYGYWRRLVFALLAGVLVLLTGLPLVESRLALINIYWVWFGLLGQFCWIVARGKPGKMQAVSVGQVPGDAKLWRVGAGLGLGAAIAVKWNGAGFWLGIVLLELLGQWRRSGQDRKPHLPWPALLVHLGLLPWLTYAVLWIPHLRLNQVSLVEIHRQLWTVHQSIGEATAPHPYCSAWYTWPLMLRPLSYFYEVVSGPMPDSILAPAGRTIPSAYTVQAMGNPLLWWLATAAVLALGAGWVSRRLGKPKWPGKSSSGTFRRNPPTGSNDRRRDDPVVSFVLVNYASNWLPWMVVGRCTFLYHALGLVVFADLALAWLLSRWLLGHRWHHQALAGLMMLVILWSYWFWLPVFLGLPLSPEALQRRWWLPSWI
jgi:dolichyl-phosphate-mannose--protein O-mannosyl transferase